MKIEIIKKSIVVLIGVSMITIFSCKKDEDDDQPVETPVTELQILTDFANVLVNPNYQEIKLKAGELNVAIQTLNVTTTDVNLHTAQEAWRATRTPWEQAEGYLFGPVEDYNYDPATDSWPVNTVEMDSLLASNNPLQLANIDSLPFSLKGYHPIEYLLFGVGGIKTASQFTVRELQYLVSLSQSLLNITTQLSNSWDPNQPGNFTEQLITAGNGSLRYSTRKDAFLAIATSMQGICGEVANNKMEVPLAAHDSELVESQYAHNATIDFRNNILGIQNAYLCRYTTTGKSLHDLVKSKNISLDNLIQDQINSAYNSLLVINPNYGEAIFTQQNQIIIAQNEINNLEGSLNLLINFIQTNITD